MDILVEPEGETNLKRPHEEEEGAEGGEGSPSKVARIMDEEVEAPPSPASVVLEQEPTPSKMDQLVAGLEDELWCPLCAAVLYGPVTVSPCGHPFCGSCLALYLRNSSPKPHTCPSCRGTASSAAHSRTLGSLCDLLIAHAPEKQRAQGERDQADDEWAVGESLKFGNPPPPPSIPRPSEYYRSCRYCDLGNGLGWHCPIPVPPADSVLAYPLDGPCPEGHLSCSSCSTLAATEAPTTKFCNICETGYCGLAQASCTPSLFASTKPGGTWGSTAMALGDTIYDPPVDELSYAFKDNLEELRIFAEFVSSHPELTPVKIYGEILEWVLSDEGKQQGGARGIFRRVDEGLHSNLPDTRNIERMCLSCSDDLFAVGLYEWWARRRPLVLNELEKRVQRKPDCKNGRLCYRQGNAAHSKKFNHVCSALPEDLASAVEQNDDPLPASPHPAQRSSSPASEVEGGEEDAVMASSQDVGQASGESQESHPSSDEAVENVDIGIGASGTSGIEIDDDSSSDEESDGEGSPRMNSIGVQTEENVPSLSLDGNDRVIVPTSVVEAQGLVAVEDVASNHAEMEDLPPPPPAVAHHPPPAPASVSSTSTQAEGVAQVVVVAVEEMNSDLPLPVSDNAPSPSSGPGDAPIPSGLEPMSSTVQNEPVSASMEAEGSGTSAEVEDDDDGEGSSSSEADRTLVRDVSPSFFKDMSLGNGSAIAMEEGGAAQVEQEQREFGRNEEDVLMASS